MTCSISPERATQGKRVLFGYRKLAIIPCILVLVMSASPGMAVPPEPTEKTGNCSSGSIQLSIRANIVGLPLAGSSVQIDGSNAKLMGRNQDECPTPMVSVPTFQWNLISKPRASNATLSGGTSLTPSLNLDRQGSYKVRFTACPTKCSVSIAGRAVSVPAQHADTDITAVGTITVPPELEPEFGLPFLPATNPTDFSESEREEKCALGGGALDPQWVTTSRWDGPQDYELLEGEIGRSRISRKDNFLNHESQDHNFSVYADGPSRRLVSKRPEWPEQEYTLGVEWERDHFPERFRPTPGDRASVFGYWIFDCGHPPFYTEIHPPVGVAVHRPRPVQIPPDFRPAGFPNGFGRNVFVPGIITNIFFNRHSGEITSNCSDTGLAQPGQKIGGTYYNGRCIRGPSPINRTFTFNIYLPPDPRVLMRRLGRTAPPVPIFTRTLGTGGPNPTITRRTSGDATWLEVSVDLGSFTGEQYDRKILAAWAYPAADNWGLRSWRLRLDSMKVHDDGDDLARARGDGDWRFWVNTNNGAQEWTKLYDCAECVHGTETFPSSTHTGADLGPDLLLFPKQHIWVHTSGFDGDSIIDTDTGSVNDLITHGQADRACTYNSCMHFSRSHCSEDCADYTLHYELRPAAPVGNAALSAEATALATAYTIRPDTGARCTPIDKICVLLPINPALQKRDWHPADLVLRPGTRTTGASTRLLKPQPTETFVITDASLSAIKRTLATASKGRPAERVKVKRFMAAVKAEADRSTSAARKQDVLKFLREVKRVVPRQLHPPSD
ncbi:hypothetical protein ACIBQ1_34355 [Nonomuraea sp. NPDC050153]|uniref:hypothetical protein n=1 Tax=Nonomuraea sp. NPDC050153 TaxID=3364359 RepID=UPI0037952ACD